MRKSMMMIALLGGLLTVPSLGAAQDTKSNSQTAAAKRQAQKKPPSAAQLALRDRQKKCAAEWKQAKADGKIENGMKWPQYWSACNKRLKAAAM